jgi:hypothetical protein
VKMNRIAAVAAALFGLAAAQTSMACSLTAWGQGNPPGATGVVGAPVAGEPDDAVAVKRYSGRCGLQAGTGAYVQDGLPTAEATYNAQFYMFTAANGTYFQADDGAAAAQIKVSYDGANIVVERSAGGTPASVVAAANRWFRVLVKFNATAGTLGYTVRGAGAAEASAVSGSITGVNNAARIETAKLGLLTGTGTATVDAFESRRTSDPAPLCRGDANADVLIGVQDRIILTNEILQTALASGQPDVNEDGLVSVQDRILITNRILAGDTCP